MLRLHWSPDSANLVVRIALHRFGLTYESTRVNRAARQQRSPEHLALNPQGLLPVLEDGELVLFETGAILLHLADRAGRLGHNSERADEPKARALFSRWLFYASNTLHAELRVAFYAYRFVPQEAIAALREGIRGRFAKHLDLLETEVARQGALAGPRATLVDDYLGACVRWAQNYPTDDRPILDDLQPWPALSEHLGRLETAPELLAACREEFIEDDRPFTEPSRPALPTSEVTG
ncbi:MAG: glutathione S-transferase family protein [Pseudomonadota bacterium]